MRSSAAKVARLNKGKPRGIKQKWIAAKRFQQKSAERKIILHLGDHDPSGIDMTRDIQERLNLFEAEVVVKRIALQMEQIEELKLPPNPVKLTDSRCGDYIKRFGSSSWELDALKPQYIENLIKENIKEYIDFVKFQAVEERERKQKEELTMIEENYDNVVEYLNGE